MILLDIKLQILHNSLKAVIRFVLF